MDIRREENSVPGVNVVLIYFTKYERSKTTKKSAHQKKKILYDRCERSIILCTERKKKEREKGRKEEEK
jgi:hypothetical protein